mmetsp:Transcript_29166/g.50379  ORF Transcript_29166/g.50379 Transcript_29166/m.50379 type:complete len:118 (+) Transcript_29166:134-487(+)
MKKLGMNACGCQPKTETESTLKLADLVPWIVGACWFIPLSGPPLLRRFTYIYFLYLAIVTRGAVRSRYNIPGSRFEDCMWSVFCSCCTLLQSYRHMKRSGDTPFKGCGDPSVTKAIR